MYPTKDMALNLPTVGARLGVQGTHAVEGAWVHGARALSKGARLHNLHAWNEVCAHTWQLGDLVWIRPWRCSPGSWVQVKKTRT